MDNTSPTNAAVDTYRPEIQGLRAVAVIAVVLYHARMVVFPGGFVGVDIFFVISGFLITRILFREIDATGLVNLPAFWARRAKRLLPNALLTLTAVLAASAVLLPAYRRPDIAADVGASAVFFSNFHFAAKAVDYFRVDEPPSPVLHFWSLSLEEQFYILWPLLLLLIACPLGRWRMTAAKVLLAAIAVSSLALSLIAITESQPAAFFHTQNRAWQLALGGLTGAFFHLRAHIPGSLRALMTWAGVCAIVLSLTALNDDLVYPGLYALAPTLGTVMVFIGMDSGALARPVFKVLSLAPMRWVGDRSYSLYLWHWPLLAFADVFWQGQQTAALAAILLTVLVAHLAYVYVERPIHRLPLQRVSLPYAWLTSVAGVALVCGGSAAAYFAPLPKASDDRSAEIKAARSDLSDNYKSGCHVDYAVVVQPPCIYGRRGGERTVVLFGDSHAGQWGDAVSRAADEEGWEARIWTKSSCSSADIVVWFVPRKTPFKECSTWRENVLAEIETTRPDLVILANMYNYSGWIIDPRSREVLRGNAARAEVLRGYRSTVDRLLAAGIAVAIVHDTPRVYKDYALCLVHSDSTCPTPRQEALGDETIKSALLREYRGRVSFLDVSDRLCSKWACPAVMNGAIAYRDEHHLTNTLAVSLWDSFQALLRERSGQSASSGP